MAQIIPLSHARLSPGVPAMGPDGSCLPALMRAVSAFRRSEDDVLWMKEVAECLNILECTGRRVPREALDLFAPLYATLPDRMRFFPQYYRFWLSIALDLEALGFPGESAARLCDWVARQGLAAAELSDLQRAEARRLMARRGIDPLPGDGGLEDRLRGFAARNETFGLPNRKAAYELTHAVFYLSDYGRRDPKMAPGTRESLRFTGFMAFLDRDCDLLAEVCIALRHCRAAPPAAWEAMVAERLASLRLAPGRPEGEDGYHEFMVGQWLMTLSGGASFAHLPPTAAGPALQVVRPEAAPGALLALSQVVQGMRLRSPDWTAMRLRVHDALPEEASRHLAAAEASAPGFERFFRVFARAELPLRTPA